MTEATGETLMICPFCGSEDIHLIDRPTESWACRDCGFVGFDEDFTRE